MDLRGAANNKNHIATDKIQELFRSYSGSRKPIDIDIRELVSWVKYGDHLTHFIHPYPAKLVPHIPALFGAAEQFSSEKDVIVDPFGGSGTVALEAVVAGRNAETFDCNPLAVLIAKVKTTLVDERTVCDSMKRIAERYLELDDVDIPDVVNINHWFYPHTIRDLARIRSCIDRIRTEDVRDFLAVCLSNAAKRLSLADQRLSVPVRLSAEAYPAKHKFRIAAQKRLKALRVANVWTCFEDVVERNLSRNRALREVFPEGVRAIAKKSNVLQGAIAGAKHGARTTLAQVVITSPPYLGAQKYIRASSFGLGWLSLCKSSKLKILEKETIGREHFREVEYRELSPTDVRSADKLLKEVWRVAPLRAQMAALYLNEMRSAITNIRAMLAPSGSFVLVLGNNMVSGRVFETVRYMKEVVLELGFRLRLELTDHIRSRGLMTKRNRTAGLIDQESILVFERI